MLVGGARSAMGINALGSGLWPVVGVGKRLARWTKEGPPYYLPPSTEASRSSNPQVFKPPRVSRPAFSLSATVGGLVMGGGESLPQPHFFSHIIHACRPVLSVRYTQLCLVAWLVMLKDATPCHDDSSIQLDTMLSLKNRPQHVESDSVSRLSRAQEPHVHPPTPCPAHACACTQPIADADQPAICDTPDSGVHAAPQRLRSWSHTRHGKFLNQESSD